jgi:hypothetical protein
MRQSSASHFSLKRTFAQPCSCCLMINALTPR